MSKKCTTCGYENDDKATFCSHCGSVLPRDSGEVKDDNNIYQERQEVPAGNEWAGSFGPKIIFKKKSLVAIVLFICICVLVFIGVQRCNYAKNVKKYVYTQTELFGQRGEGSYFEVDYNNNRYKYSGARVFYGTFRDGTQEQEGFILYEKTVSGAKYYTFSNNPWGTDTYVVIYENTGSLYIYSYDLLYPLCIFNEKS